MEIKSLCILSFKHIHPYPTLEWLSFSETGTEDYSRSEIWIVLEPRCMVKVGYVTAQSNCGTKLDM